MQNNDLIEAINNLQPHDHLCLIYETQDEQFEAAIPYIHEGLKQGEKCIYIADENTVESVQTEMNKTGIDVDFYQKSGALSIVTSQESYVKGGSFDPDRMIQFLENLTKQAKEEGYSALRVTGEMTWVLAGDPGSERVMEYEARLNYFIGKNDCLAICQYNRNKFSPDTILDVIHTHPLVIFGRTVANNFYYIPPDEFLQPGQASLEVDRLLSNIVEREKLEKRLKQEKKLEKSRYQQLFNNLGSAVAVYQAVDEGNDFIFKEFNKAAEKIEKVKKEDVLGKSVLEVFPAVKDFGLFEVLQRVWQTGEAEHHPVSLYKDNRISGWRDNYVYKIPSGEIVAVYEDVTERKKAEQEKESLNTALKSKNKELKQILYATSHDLRTPLVNIQGFNQELKESLEELKSILNSSQLPDKVERKMKHIVDEEIPESMHFISSSASKMDTMLSGLLSLSRLGQKRLNIKKLDVNQIVEEVVSNFQYQIKDNNIKIDIDDLPDCVGDGSQINQVFTNLISNALKYLDPDRQGKITISGQKDNQWSNYSVKDNGVGIPEAQQKKIFNLFHQSDPKRGGIGLGLNIIKQIIDRHKGDISVESQKGQGTKFTISLPHKKSIIKG
jgi:signal transduction histidine kinase